MSAGVVIGRFAPPQAAEVALVQRALAENERAVVVLGSAFHARTPRDPFDTHERAEMFRLCLAEPERGRLAFVPVRDYFDDARWSAAVAALVAQAAQDEAPRLYVHDDERAQRYAEWFVRWPQVRVAGPPAQPSDRLRAILLQHDMARSPATLSERRDAALAVLSDWVPAATIEYLRAWAALPAYAELVRDQHALDAMNDEWRGAPHEPIFSTVDAVVRCAGHVLLVRRGAPPGRGLRALPGGFLEPRETLLESAMRELREETGLGVHPALLRRALERVQVFSHPRRSLRGRTITHAHFFDLAAERLPDLRAGDDAAAADWIPVAELPGLEDQLFEDHFHILDEFLRIT
jgi:bifunctional NMN adenylyltransferase/nudix hydrolase